MKEDYHIDMSGRIYKRVTIGVACVGAISKKHNGCALKGNMTKLIQEKLYVGSTKEEHAKIYAICIYLLIKDKLKDIGTLIICNDEDFTYVKKYLLILLRQTPSFQIINISDLRRKLGRDISSLADNFATSYRKRALSRVKWKTGKPLDIVQVTYEIIKSHWEKLK